MFTWQYHLAARHWSGVYTSAPSLAPHWVLMLQCGYCVVQASHNCWSIGTSNAAIYLQLCSNLLLELIKLLGCKWLGHLQTRTYWCSAIFH